MSSRRDWDGTRGPRLRKVASLPLRLSLSLCLPWRDRDFRSKAGGGGRFASVSRRPTDSHHAACASLSRGGLVPSSRASGEVRFDHDQFFLLLFSAPSQTRSNSPKEFSQEDLWRFEDRKKGEHPSIHDEGPGARLWFGNETPKRIPPPYTLFVLFLKRFLLYKSFSN